MSQQGKDREGTFERAAEQLGGATGRAFGAGVDRATDIATSLFGTAINSLSDWWSSSDARRAAESFDAGRDRSCREHFNATPAAADRDYEEIRPLYQFGHMARQDPEFHGRAFGEVEPDLRAAWEAGERKQDVAWPEARGYVGFGFSTEGGAEEGAEEGDTPL